MSPTVHVVDDDEDMRDALSQLLDTAGLRVEVHADGAAFLEVFDAGHPGCILLDMAMPGMTGLEVQAALRDRGFDVPIVFLTGNGDIPMAVKAMKAGAADFLEKPIRGAELIERVKRALHLDAERRTTHSRTQDLLLRYASLSEREKEIMALAVSGLTSKEIARQLGISPRTVEVHRTHVMHKMGAANVADLVNIAAHCRA